MALIILDRDGVINQDSDQFVKTVDEFVFLDGSVEAIAALSKAGHKIYIATNQSGIARDYLNLETLDAMHNKLLIAVKNFGGAVQGILFCPHVPDDSCDCRQPKPGLGGQILAEQELTSEELRTSIMISDSIRDLQVGDSKKLKQVFVTTGQGKKNETD